MITFCIVHYNTPELLTANIASVIKHHTDARIVVFENSDKYKFENIFDECIVQIIDNSTSNYINFQTEIDKLIGNNNLCKANIYEAEAKVSNFGSFKHSISVQFLVDNINTDFILLDSDVLLKSNVSTLIQHSNIFCADVVRDVRALPFIMYLNTHLIKLHNLTFCDYKHILPVKGIANYDTGGWLLQQCQKNKLPFSTINYNDYVIHYGNGSWKENGNKCSSLKTFKIDKFSWLHTYKHLYT